MLSFSIGKIIFRLGKKLLQEDAATIHPNKQQEENIIFYVPIFYIILVIKVVSAIKPNRKKWKILEVIKI